MKKQKLKLVCDPISPTGWGWIDVETMKPVKVHYPNKKKKK